MFCFAPVSTSSVASSMPNTRVSLIKTYAVASSSSFAFASSSMKALTASSMERALSALQAHAKTDTQFETPSKTACEQCFKTDTPNHEICLRVLIGN